MPDDTDRSDCRLSSRSDRIAAHGLALLLALACAVAGADDAALVTKTTPAAGERFVVRGLTGLDPDLLARSLLAHDELLLLKSPLASRKAYLAAVADKARLALQHEGFAEARVTAHGETIDGIDCVAIDVAEGPRQMAAGIDISGLPDELAQELKRWLKSQRPPPGSVPQSYDVEDGWSGTRWLDPRGQPARLEPPAWRPGQPAPCDAPHLFVVRTAIARLLRDEGYFAAARLLDTPKPAAAAAGGADPAAASCHVEVRHGENGATLAIDFRNLPPPAVLSGIELFPGSRTTTAELQALLGITVGNRVTERDRLTWRESLRLSGRFVRHEVKFQETTSPEHADAAPGIVAIFDLDAYPRVPSLAEPLPREDLAMLMLRGWLLKTLADENDLVLHWTPAAQTPAISTPTPQSGTTAAGPQPVGGLVVSTHQGVLLTALPGSPEACGVAVSGDGLGWFLPHEAGRFEVPLPTRRRFAVNVGVSIAETIDQGHHSYRQQLDVDYGLEPRPRDAAAAVSITARIEPVACIAMLHEGDPRITWEGEILVVERPEWTARIDADTGRLVSVEIPGWGRITVDAAPGRLPADLAALRTAAGHDLTRTDALVSSGIEFFTGDSMAAALDHLVEAFGLGQRSAGWRTVLAIASGKLRQAAASGGFSAADRAVAGLLARGAGTASSSLLTIPNAQPTPPTADPAMRLARLAAERALRWAECTCGREAWPTALSRVAALAARRDPAVIWELSSFMTSPRNGPLANLAAATAIATPMPSMAASFAHTGRTRLSAEAFHEDCRPLLAALACSGIDRAAVALLRTIDDDEARRLGTALLGDPTILAPLVREIRTRESEAAAVAALPEILDRWWVESLHSVVNLALAAQVDLHTADKPAGDANPLR